MTTLEVPNQLRSLTVELQRQLTTKSDIVADTRRFSFAVPAGAEAKTVGSLAAFSDPLQAIIDIPEGAEAFGVTRFAHNQISENIGVPFRLYERLLGKHPDLLAGLANGLLSREPSKRLVRTLDGRVRAFLSDRYRPRDNWDLLEHLLPVLASFPEVQFKQCALTDTRLYIKTFLPGMECQVTPKVGDVIRGGVIISNSEVGAGSLYIYPYTDRLICLNGMVHSDFGQRRIHVGRRIESTEEAYAFYSDETMKLDDRAFFAKCTDTLRGCLNEAVFEAIAQQMRDLAEINIPGSPVDAVEVLAKKQGFNDGEKDSILRFVIEGGDLSAWGYVNAITATARELPDADRQTEIEMLAGRMTSDPAWTQAVAA